MWYNKKQGEENRDKREILKGLQEMGLHLKEVSAPALLQGWRPTPCLKERSVGKW